jgi:hypothetical protein
MSKKRVKKAAGKPAKAAAKKAVARVKKKVVRRGPGTAVGPSKRTAAVTIFVYDTAGGLRVRTSPQLLATGPGVVEWTVVNLSSDVMPDVDITWPDDGPWGGAPIPIRNGNVRMSLAGAKAGRFKYNVTCGGFTEDPELEYPEM